MIIELIRIFVPYEKEQEFARAVGSLAGPIEVQNGCLNCGVTQNLVRPSELQLEARWETEEDLTRHLRSDAYKQLLLLMELGSAPPVVEFLRVVEMGGLDLVENAFSRAN
jgi:quinol monooxygenase YgiN